MHRNSNSLQSTIYDSTKIFNKYPFNIYSKVIFLFLFNVSYLEFFLNGNKIKKNVKTFATPVRTIIIKM